MIHRQRIARLRTMIREQRLDGLLVSSLPNIRYLTGFSGSNALCVITRSTAVFVSDPRYMLQSKAEAAGMRRLITPLGLFEGTARHRLLKGMRTVGFESQHVTYAQYRSLKKLFPTITFRPTNDLVESLVLIKDADEVALIRRAVKITDRVFREVVDSLRPGMKETDVAARISYLQKVYGAERDAFDTIVASGERGALPHAKPSAKRIRRGEFVTLDFGCTIGGYSSDLTRTVATGKPSRRMREVYDVVLTAQRAAVAATHGSMAAKDLDAIARRSIASAGYGKFFTHGLGHGLGLHVHERPRVSALSKEILHPGTVITIEPGVYIPGFGGVRIEDDVLVTERGCRVLTHAPKELIIV